VGKGGTAFPRIPPAKKGSDPFFGRLAAFLGDKK
jgi:hypothetical protein